MKFLQLASNSPTLQIGLSVGMTAAILTGAEFVLSIVAAFSMKAIIHGAWLLHLHRNGHAHYNDRSRKFQGVIKDVLTAGLGVWFLFSVALVESNLEATYLVSEEKTLSSACVRMDSDIAPQAMRSLIPSIRAGFEPWALIAANALNCGRYGVGHVGTGGVTNKFGKKENLTAPVCRSSLSNVSGSIFWETGMLKTWEMGTLTFVTNRSPMYEFIPYSSKGLGMHFHSALNTVDGTRECGKKGISDLFTGMETPWSTTFTMSMIVDDIMHQAICQSHPNEQPVIPLDLNLTIPCVIGSQSYIDARCLRKNALTSDAKDVLGHKVYLTDVATLLVAERLYDQSYACLNGTVVVEYVFVNLSVINNPSLRSTPTLPVLVVTALQIERGDNAHCEMCPNALCRAALLYTVDTEWQQSELFGLDRLTRYYTYLISVSSSQFPLSSIDPYGNLTGLDCFVRKMTEVTSVAMDWRMLSLLTAVAISAVVFMGSCAFCVLYRGESWKVGSTSWLLNRLSMKRRSRHRIDEENESHGVDTIVEVVPHAQIPSMSKTCTSDHTTMNSEHNTAHSWGWPLSRKSPRVGRADAVTMKFRYRLRSLPGRSDSVSRQVSLTSNGDNHGSTDVVNRAENGVVRRESFRSDPE